MNQHNLIAFIIVAVIAFWIGVGNGQSKIYSEFYRCHLNQIEPQTCVNMVWPNFGKDNTNGQ